MARTSIGLDIGTRAVRLAEVQQGSDGPTLTRFGRVLLPAGAVEHGEVHDPQAVAAAITKLWKRLGLTGKAVHVGVANRRVVVRTIEMPAMSQEDLESAIKFQAQEHMPIPLDEAVMDFEILEEIEGENNERSLRVLVVAAERATIAPLLSAVQAAHLEPATLELNAYPLVRCFGNGSTAAEAIVDIGAGVTNVVVQQGGKIRFTRILPTFGGDEFTSAIAQALNISHEEAEKLKRQASSLLAERVLHPRPQKAPKRVPAMAGVSSRAVVPVAPMAPSAPSTPLAPSAPVPVAPSAPVEPTAPAAANPFELSSDHYDLHEEDDSDVSSADAVSDSDFLPEPAVLHEFDTAHEHEQESEEVHETHHDPEPALMAEPVHVTLHGTPIEQAVEVIEPLLDRFVTEVRGSLDFYAGQPGAAELDHVVLTGGGALMGGIAEQLSASLGVEVKQGQPFDRVPIGRVDVTSEERAVAEPFIGLAVGLALAGMGA
jgi:type IV pilus assembly protein PilM